MTVKRTFNYQLFVWGTVYKLSYYALVAQVSYFCSCQGEIFSALWIVQTGSDAQPASYFMDISYPGGGRDSSVVIATRYGLDGLGIESRWGWDFPHPSRPALRPTQSPVQWLPGGKAAGEWCWQPTPSKYRGHERVELYLYLPSALVACYGENHYVCPFLPR